MNIFDDYEAKATAYQRQIAELSQQLQQKEQMIQNLTNELNKLKQEDRN